MSLNFERSRWTRHTFGDLVANINDYYRPESDGKLPYVAGPHITGGSPTVSGYGSTDDPKFPPTFKRKFQRGDVLLHSRGIEKLASVDRVGVTGEKLFVLRSIDGNVLSQSFLQWLLMSPSAQQHMADNFTGSVNKFLNWRPLANFEFDLPPLDEQKRIADLLWAVEHHRVSVQAAYQSARAVLTRIRAEMFEGGEKGARAAELFHITIGRQRSPKHATGAHVVPYLRSANVTLSGIDVQDVKMMNFEPKEQAKFALIAGDVLVSEASASAPSVGIPAVWREELPTVVCFQNTLLRYRAIEGVSLPAFVEHYCHWAFESGSYLAAASGTNIRHIGVGGATTMLVPRVEINAQHAFTERASVVSRAIEDLERELLATTMLSSSLISQFGGGN